MTFRSPMIVPAVLVLTALAALPAHACPGCSASSLCVLPGYAPLAGAIGLVFPILTGIIERPFLSLGGISSRAIWLSILANFCSMLVCTFTSIFFDGFLNAMGIGAILSLLVAVFIEFGMLKGATTLPNWRLFSVLAIANILSAVVLFTIPFWRDFFGTDGAMYSRQWNRVSTEIQLITFFCCMGIFVLAFVRAYGHWNIEKQIDNRRGFEVIQNVN